MSKIYWHYLISDIEFVQMINKHFFEREKITTPPA